MGAQNKSNISLYRELPKKIVSSKSPASESSKTSLELVDSEYTVFLEFVHQNDIKEYKEYTKKQIYPISFKIFIIATLSAIFTKINFRDGLQLGPLFTASVVLTIIGLFLLLLFTCGRHFETLSGQRLPKYCRRLLDFTIDIILQDEIESIMLFAFVLSFNLAVVAMVIVGECSTDATNLLSCNVLAKSNCPPISLVTIMFISPLALQIFIKNVRKCIWALSWFTSVITVVWSLHYLNGWEHYNLLLFGTIFGLLPYEYERIQVSSFLKTKHMLRIEKDKLIDMEREHREKEAILSELNEARLKEEKSRIDLEIIELAVKNEVKLKDAETAQLRSLLGNVAHDLKTPIHSVVMDVETLKNSYLTASAKITGLQDYMKENEDQNPMTIFESLEASCKFMTMSINRCLDYTKSASNMALQPAMETFELLSGTTNPVRCIMNHANANDHNRIIVHPISSEICQYLISDKHWFSENLLCLLSNAVKYSDKDSSVEVKIQLISENSLFVSEEPEYPVVNSKSSKSVLSSFTDLDKTCVIFAELKEDSSSNPSISKKLSLCKSQSSVSMTVSGITDSEFSSTAVSSIKSSDAIANLMSKGLYSPSSGARQMIRVSVEDRGIGIPEDDRKNLFQPFKQAQRMTGGTGLGLYSLYKRMEALNGYCGVDVRSDGLNGSVFWFAFPYRPDFTYSAMDLHSLSKPCTQESKSQESPSPKLNIPLRILLIDDSPSILKITSRSLKSRGHHVEVEEDGSQGLQKIKSAFLKQEFDVILTDLQMPVMDGFTFVKRFREYEDEALLAYASDNSIVSNSRKCYNYNGKLLIIGMSANSDDVSKQEALSSGMDQFIAKPFVYEDFWKTVKPFIVHNNSN